MKALVKDNTIILENNVEQEQKERCDEPVADKEESVAETQERVDNPEIPSTLSEVVMASDAEGPNVSNINEEQEVTKKSLKYPELYKAVWNSKAPQIPSNSPDAQMNDNANGDWKKVLSRRIQITRAS